MTTDAAAFAQRWQQLLHQEERCAHVDGEEPVEVLDGGVLDGRGLGDAGVGHQHVEPATDDGAHALRQQVDDTMEQVLCLAANNLADP